MLDEDRKELSRLRFEHAVECLNDAKVMLVSNSYKSAANRAYYAIFHGMRAVLILDGIDSKKHSGIIAEFQRRYIKTDAFPKDTSMIISSAFNIRTNSDYNDFYIVSKEDVQQQIDNADVFIALVGSYLDHR